MNDLRAEIRFKNAILWNELQKQFGDVAGAMVVYRTKAVIRTASEVLGVSRAVIGGLLNLRISPYKTRGDDIGNPKASAKAIAAGLGIEVDQLFPPSLYKLKLPRILVREFESPTVLSLQEAAHELKQLAARADDPLLEAERRLVIDEVLHTLPTRQEQVVRLRLGLGENAEEHTLQEIAVKYRVGVERIRQIEAQGLRCLRHPSRSNKLRGLIR